MVKERKNLEKPKGFVEFNNEAPKPKWYKVVGVTLFGATLCGALGLGGFRAVLFRMVPKL